MSRHYVCPRNGEPQPCRREAPEIGVPGGRRFDPCAPGLVHVHRVEELVADDSQFRPWCETHGIRLEEVRA